MKLGVIFVLGMVALAGCSKKENVLVIDGTVYHGKAKADRKDRASFVATGGPAAASVDGARQAAVFEGVKYCIGYLGTSNILWESGPESPDEEIVTERGTVEYRGRCIEP